MVQIDTAELYKPVVVLSLFLGFVHYLSIIAFPPMIIIMVIFALAIYSLKDDGKYVKYAIPLLLIDLLFLIILDLTLPLILGAWVGLFINMLIMFFAVRREKFYFDRTIQSMNDRDRELARKALRTGKAEDFAKVADYTDWNLVGSELQ